jgi:hypothetical protein
VTPAPLDWNAPAKLIARSDSGSELSYEFRDVQNGTLAAMVAAVRDMDATERSRVLLDAGGQGTFPVGEILALAARADFPGA